MAVNNLSRYMTSAAVRHWEQAKRVLRYLLGTFQRQTTTASTHVTRFLLWRWRSHEIKNMIRCYDLRIRRCVGQ